MKRKSIILPALLLAVASSFAAPVMPGHKKTLTLADGTSVTAEQFGDEYMSWWETADGKKYVISSDGKMFVPADFTAMRGYAQKRRAAMARDMRELAYGHKTYKGHKKGLIILVQFADTKFQDNHTQDYYNTIANQRGFTSDEGYIGSVSDYFYAQSNGQFEMDFDVVGPVTLSKGYAYYGANNGNVQDVNVGKMIKEATDAIASQVNFADYDWNNDGTADQVFYLYAGLGENASDDTNTIWAHMSYMHYHGGKLTYSTGSVDTYACASELLSILDQNNNYTDKTRISGIGTICHEFSHCFGFPDTYDTNGQKLYGMGYYDLLGYGNYLGHGLTPPNFTAWERIYVGWTEPIELKNAADVEAMVSSTDYGRPFIMYNGQNHDEYYLFENRQKTGWDRKLYGKGLMITHVDYNRATWSSNKVNATGQDHQRCTIFHADNSDLLTTIAEVSDDLYPYTSPDGTITNNSLTDESAPAAILWNSHDTSLGITHMGKPITDITQNSDGTISFRVMGGDSNNIINNDNNTTGIKTATTNSAQGSSQRVFSIEGTMLGNDIKQLPHGIYIINGRKVVK